jgi:hypothetical protein
LAVWVRRVPHRRMSGGASVNDLGRRLEVESGPPALRIGKTGASAHLGTFSSALVEAVQ